MRDDFVIFILTHGRAKEMRTYEALKNAGNTNRVVFVIDNEDKTAQEYYDLFGRRNVYMFDKLAVAHEVDSMDLSTDRRAILYARCACFNIAKELGYKYFLELDDDYVNFRCRVDDGKSLKTSYIKDFDRIVDIMLEFLDTTKAHTVALSQTGDFIGGRDSRIGRLHLIQKAMNSFFCRTDKPFKWSGRMNEDVTAYLTLGSRGYLFFTVGNASIDQLSTQSLSGGMSASYADSGTYIKTFYTVMSVPSCVKVYTIGTSHKRFHHLIDWEHAIPKIISDVYRR